MTVLVCALKHCHQIRKQAEVCRTRCSTIRLCQMSSSPPNERTGALPRCIRSAACPALCLLNSSPADMTNMHATCPSILYCDIMQLQKTEGLRSSAWLDTPLSVAACQSLGRWQPSVSAYVLHDVLIFFMMAIILKQTAVSCCQETCIIMPQLKLIFDTGRCPRRAPYQRTVLLSHAHMDHVGGLHFHVSTRYSFHSDICTNRCRRVCTALTHGVLMDGPDLAIPCTFVS